MKISKLLQLLGFLLTPALNVLPLDMTRKADDSTQNVSNHKSRIIVKTELLTVMETLEEREETFYLPKWNETFIAPPMASFQFCSFSSLLVVYLNLFSMLEKHHKE